jgi:hypothetical protein
VSDATLLHVVAKGEVYLEGGRERIVLSNGAGTKPSNRTLQDRFMIWRPSRCGGTVRYQCPLPRLCGSGGSSRALRHSIHHNLLFAACHVALLVLTRRRIFASECWSVARRGPAVYPDIIHNNNRQRRRDTAREVCCWITSMLTSKPSSSCWIQ